VKKLIVTTIGIFALLLSLQQSYDAKEEEIEKTVEINEEIINTYETRIKSNDFPDKRSKKNYTNGYRGFLHWITNYEYKELDKEFKTRSR